MKSLYAKLALGLFLLFGVVGAFYVGLTLFTTRRYFEEINQKLNQSLAENLLKEKLLIRNGEVDREALEEIFHMMMVIHPQIELYLLDPKGDVLAFSAPPGSVVRDKVSLDPIHQFLDGSSGLPILGDNPRSRDGRKVFSAAPIPSPGDPKALEGYIYVVLGGEEYDSVAQMLEGSYILRLSTFLAAGGLIFALLSGLFFFRHFTRRIETLTETMEGFEATGAPAPAAGSTSRSRDEIDRLSETFHRMSHRIAEQVEEIQKKDRLRRDLVASVSHDLRTPLASLHGYLETLLLKEGKASPEEQRQYLDIALRHSERLSRLVSELFELAKLDAEDVPVHRERFSMAELVQDVVQEFQLEAQRRNILLRAELPSPVPPVDADIGLMERVLENLVENALRYTPEKGAVTVTLAREDGRVRVEVTDTGCGIPADELPLIFDRFYRASENDRRESSGAGLGLAITKRILELHGASIAAQSTVGAGSVFRFSLPAASGTPSPASAQNR